MSLYETLTDKLDQLYREQERLDDELSGAEIELHEAQTNQSRVARFVEEINEEITELEELLKEKYGYEV